MKKIVAAVFTVSMAVAQAQAGGAAWTEDFEAAKALAAKEGKDLLIDFTGSDWCGWCKRLDAEVFDVDPFRSEAPKQFILVKLDFPRQTPQDPKIKEQNGKLQAEFKVQGFPSIYLADAAGKPYARTGYRPGGAEPYLKHLAELRGLKGQDEALKAKADAAQGVEKAKLLDAYLAVTEKTGMARGGRKKIVGEIVALDADNAAGLKAKYEVRQKLETAQAAMQKQDIDGALAALDEVIASPSADGAAKQQAYFGKGMILMQAKKDKDGALAAMEAAHKAAPESENAAQIAQTIQQIRQAPGGGGRKKGGLDGAH